MIYYTRRKPLLVHSWQSYHNFYYHNNTCSFCIFIGRELCVIKVHTHGLRQLMAWSNLANLFRGSSHGFRQLYYNAKQIDFIFLCFCTVIDHIWRHSKILKILTLIQRLHTYHPRITKWRWISVHFNTCTFQFPDEIWQLKNTRQM